MKGLDPNLEVYQVPLVIKKIYIQVPLTIYGILPVFSAWVFGFIHKVKDITIRSYKELGNAFGDW